MSMKSVGKHQNGDTARATPASPANSNDETSGAATVLVNSIFMFSVSKTDPLAEAAARAQTHPKKAALRRNRSCSRILA
jgi:hypothetical protein